MTRSETGILVVFVVLIVSWAALGPGGWVSGVVGAVVGIVLGAGLVLAGRRRARR